MLLARFEPITPSRERPQTHVLLALTPGAAPKYKYPENTGDENLSKRKNVSWIFIYTSREKVIS
jgi:hypothetical protein